MQLKSSGAQPLSVETRCLMLDAKAETLAEVAPRLTQRALSVQSHGDVPMALVEVKAAAVNPSDVKAALGMMPYAVFPRVPGRDFAGVVIDGPRDLIGQGVFGSSGDLGIRRDGTHASHLCVEVDALVAKPAAMPFPEAAGIGVPFVTAAEGLRRAGFAGASETVLIMGVNGKVGQAAAQIASWKGSRVIGVVRKDEDYCGHSVAPIEIVNAAQGKVAETVREMTNGKGASLVYNTVGDPYYQDAHRATAVLGRQILISAINKIVEFNIFEFYRGRHTYVGIDTLALSSIETAQVLRELGEGFACGALKPFAVLQHALYPLSEAAQAYRLVMGSAKERIILQPDMP